MYAVVICGSCRLRVILKNGEFPVECMRCHAKFWMAGQTREEEYRLTTDDKRFLKSIRVLTE